MPTRVEVFLARIRPASQLTGYLTRQQRQRCARYRMAEDRARYASVRALLREVLTQRDLGTVLLRKDNRGRPFLESPPAVSQALPRISLSRSGGWVAVALCGPDGTGDTDGTGCVDVGIDLERRAAVDQPGFAGLVCCSDEARRLGRIPQQDVAGEKLRIWTAKEALLKARGVGLREDPRGISADPRPGLTVLPDVPEEGMALAVAVAYSDPGGNGLPWGAPDQCPGFALEVHDNCATDREWSVA